MPRSRNSPNAPTRVVAIVLAAGQGTRMGADRNKVFLEVAGEPILLHALRPFEACPAVDEVLLVVAPGEEDACRSLLAQAGLRKAGAVVAGGATRAGSEMNGLNALRSRIESGDIGIVLIHDAARPHVSPDLIERLASTARASGACIPALPIHEEVAHLREDGSIEQVYPPGELWRAQTPQAFDARLVLAAYDRARREGFDGTDTASTVEWAGHTVRVVEGEATNVKITTPEDLALAETLKSPGHPAT